ncbi:MAG: hypothetical protein NUV78_00305 [Candidatus Zambryskibacteria bacterium]|nr:hypothetical protein [Candidatus Zambryskibacteria bacterium]
MNGGSETQERYLDTPFQVSHAHDAEYLWRSSVFEDFSTMPASDQVFRNHGSYAIRAVFFLVDLLGLDVVEDDYESGCSDVSAFVEPLLVRAVGDLQLSRAQVLYRYGSDSHIFETSLSRANISVLHSYSSLGLAALVFVGNIIEGGLQKMNTRVFSGNVPCGSHDPFLGLTVIASLVRTSLQHTLQPSSSVFPEDAAARRNQSLLSRRSTSPKPTRGHWQMM